MEQNFHPSSRASGPIEQGAHAVNPDDQGRHFVHRKLGRCERGQRAGARATVAGRRRDFPERRCRGPRRFSSARERARTHIIIGSNSNQNGVAPDVTLGSVVIDLPLAFLTIAREVKAGTFKPGVIELGEAESRRHAGAQPRARIEDSRAGARAHRFAASADARRRIHDRRLRATPTRRSARCRLSRRSPSFSTRRSKIAGSSGLSECRQRRTARESSATSNASQRRWTFSSEAVHGAIDSGARLLIVHHGMFWGGVQPIAGHRHQRLQDAHHE